MKVLVCGSRSFSDRDFVFEQLDIFHESMGDGITHIISGLARGPDAFAVEWAEAHGVPWTGYKPDWKKHGPAGGPIRNQIMIDKNDDIKYTIAFMGSVKTTGTLDMIKKSKAKKIAIYQPEYVEKSDENQD
jgi:hypothetical protein